MAEKNLLTVNLKESQKTDLIKFCNLNQLDIEEFITFCFKKGYYIEKYGSLNENENEAYLNKRIEDLMVELQKEKSKPPRIEYIEVEKVVEKEVKVIDDNELSELNTKLKDLETENEELKNKLQSYQEDLDHNVKLNSQELKNLQDKVNNLKRELVIKDRELERLNEKINDLEDLARTKVKFLRSSNLNEDL
jgi:predicted RNase H-like nuclease (RuvC/YqgF family)